MTDLPPAAAAVRPKRDLRATVLQARQIAEDPASPPDRLMRAAIFLIKQGFLQDAVVPLRRLAAANAYPARVKRMGLVVGYLLRRGWGRDLATIDGGNGTGKGWKIVSFSPESDVHVAPRQGAERAVFVFAGVGPENRAAFDLTLLLQFLRGFEAHIFMLRDSRGLLYMDGLNGLAHGVDAAAQRLTAIARDLGARRFFTIGNCGGSYAALRYGLQMQAEAALCFAPRTDYSGALPLPDVDAAELQRLDDLLGHERRDLRALYERAPSHPRVEIFYGEGHPLDSAHARHFDGLANVRAVPVPGVSGRYIVPRLFRTGEFETAVGRLLDLPVVRPPAVRRAASPAGTPA